METLRLITARFVGLLRRRRLEREMQEEMQAHIELQAEANRARGMETEEARYAALRQFGGVAQVQERCRERRRFGWVEDFGRDLTYAARSLRRAPGFAFVAVVTLAVGIGANSTIFALFDNLLLRPVLPPGSSPAVLLLARSGTGGRAYRGFSFADLEVLRDSSEVLAQAAGFSIAPAVWGRNEMELRHGLVGLATEEFFDVCAAKPYLGRFADDGSGATVVLSHRAWRSLGGDTTALGGTVLVAGRRCTIAGIAAADFRGPAPVLAPDVWLLAKPRRTGEPDWTQFSVVARLAPGVDRVAAKSRLPALAERLDQGNATPRQLLLAEPSWTSMPGMPDTLRAGLLGGGALLLALGAVLLLIVGLNLSNLLLARGAARSRELAVRIALGAPRWRVMRLLACENLLLAAGGSILGLVLAAGAARSLGRWFAGLLERIGFGGGFDTAVDARVVAVTCGYGALVLLCAGVAPAWRSTREVSVEELHRSGLLSRAGGPLARLFAPRQLLAMAQIAGSFALLVCAGLFLRFVAQVQRLEPGFDVATNLVFSFDHELSGRDPRLVPAAVGSGQREAAYRAASERHRLEQRRHREELGARVRALPGVRAAAWASSVVFPEGDAGFRVLRAVGAEAVEGNGEQAPRVVECAVSREYFETLGIPLLAGRGFAAEEENAGRRVALLDEGAARLLFPGREAVGQMVVFSDCRAPTDAAPYEVIGLVRSPRNHPRDANPPLRIYRPLQTREDEEGASSLLFLHVAVATPEQSAGVLAAVRREAVALDPMLPVRLARTMEVHVAANPSFGLLRLVATLFALLGAVGLAVAVVGIYGVKSYLVTRRTQEIGVRLALGATPAQIRRAFLRESLAQTGVALAGGMLLALPAGLAVSRVFASVSAFDGAVVVVLAVVLGGAASAAGWWPARRAARIDPMMALRIE